MTDYPCAEFGDFIFSRFRFIMQTDRQTDRITDRMTQADDRYTHATTVGVSITTMNSIKTKSVKNIHQKANSS